MKYWKGAIIRAGSVVGVFVAGDRTSLDLTDREGKLRAVYPHRAGLACTDCATAFDSYARTKANCSVCRAIKINEKGERDEIPATAR